MRTGIVSNQKMTGGVSSLSIREDESIAKTAMKAAIGKLHPDWLISEAQMPEMKPFLGLMAHVGYYGHGYIVTWMDTNEQWICDPAGIMAKTDKWCEEEIEGITFTKHEYPLFCVYTNRETQFFVSK